MMLAFLPGPVRGVLAALLVVLNTAAACAFVYPVALVRLLMPGRAWRARCDAVMERIARAWVAGNRGIAALTQRMHRDVRGGEDLDPARSYLIVCNHRSWLDIVALFHVLHGRTPFPRFFVKQQLLWVPLIGFGMWGMGFPFVKRYSRELLERKPHLRGRDREATRRACERYRDQPVAIINFLEGTRFTPARHHRQGSGFRHLLEPRTGGLATTLDAMSEQFAALLDVTIVYPHGTPRLWDALCGRVPRVVVSIRQRRIPAQLLGGNHAEDPAFRRRMQLWVREIWSDKDALIEDLLDGRAKDRAA